MKVELLRSILWFGEHQDAGQVIEISDQDANTLIAYGKAKPYAEPKAPVVNRAVEIETSTVPKTTKRTYRKKTV